MGVDTTLSTRGRSWKGPHKALKFYTLFPTSYLGTLVDLNIYKIKIFINFGIYKVNRIWKVELLFIPCRNRWNSLSRGSHRIRNFFPRCSARWGCTSCRIPSWWKQQYPFFYLLYFLYVEFLQCLVSAIDCVLLHFLGHVGIFHHCFTVGHYILLL